MCPFIEQADSRCAACLSLHRLDDALGLCGDCYEDCSVYRKKFIDDANDSRNYTHAREVLCAAG